MTKRAATAATVAATDTTTEVATADTAPATATPADNAAAAEAAAPAAGRTRMSLADKVVRHAARLATAPLVAQPGSKFAPAHQVQPGVFLSADGSLLIARHGDDWQVSHYQVADGQVRPVGEVSTYPSAQKALMALRSAAGTA